MANLRTLLGSAEPNFTGIHSGGIGRLREGQVTYFMAHMCGNTDSSYETTCCQAPAGDFTMGYNNFVYCCWKVPSYPGAGTTAITFEIWGAGGGGAGSCCCAYGIPGGAGAYAYKTVVGVASGTPYVFRIGSPTCRVPGDTGLRGECTTVTGAGLTGFYAEGGWGGCSFCITQFCGQKCYWKTAIGASEGFGGCNNVVGLNTSCVGCCARFFGADGGAFGLPGAYGLFCHQDRCWNLHHIAYPGGLVNQKGGWVSSHQCENSTCGNWNQTWAAGQLGFGGYFENNYVPGLGGASATVCAGGCCCGNPGWAGAVRVTVRYV